MPIESTATVIRFSCALPTELTAIDDLSLADGMEGWCTAPGVSHGPWKLDKTSTTPVDGLTSVATMSGAGRWLIASSGGSGAGSGINWDDTGATPGALTSWADVYAAVQSSPGPSTIYVLGNGTVPAGIYQMRYSDLVAKGIAGEITVTLQDGALLRNVSQVKQSLRLLSISTAPVLENDPVSPVSIAFLALREGAVLENQGTAPMMVLASPTGVTGVLLQLGSRLETAATAVIEAPAGQLLLLVLMSVAVGASVTAGYALGDPTATLVISHDGTPDSPMPAPVGFGTIVNSPRNGVGLPTADRPIPFLGPLQVGLTIFDTTLGIPIWWNGLIWVDATGAPA